MDLKTYLHTNKVSQKNFAARIGASIFTVNRICMRHVQPPLDVAVRIERATEGSVTVGDLVIPGSREKEAENGEQEA